jgi:Zn-dependent protease with chaperone function
MQASEVGESCPECQARLTTIRMARWCPRCEWNLGRYDPDRHGRTFGWRWLDRRVHRTAYRQTRTQFARLAGGGLAPTLRPGRLAVVVVSLILFGTVLAMFVGGVYLVVHDFPSVSIVLGVPLVLIAILLRPRFGRLDPLMERLTRDQAPTLFALVDRVAGAMGVPPPQVIGVDRVANAAAGAVGLRRQRVLRLGLVLWVLLQPRQRVALLAHELGHFANGDIRRGLLTQPAFTTLGAAAEITRPEPGAADRAPDVINLLAAYLSNLLLGLVSRMFALLQLALLWLALRDAQRAEYLADARAVPVAGTAGTVELADRLVALDVLAMMVAQAARRTGDVAQWRAAADQARDSVADRLPALRQLSVADEASLFATHPPSGLRRHMVESLPWADPAVVLTDGESARIDEELAAWYARARMDIGALQ